MHVLYLTVKIEKYWKKINSRINSTKKGSTARSSLKLRSTALRSSMQWQKHQQQQLLCSDHFEQVSESFETKLEQIVRERKNFKNETFF